MSEPSSEPSPQVTSQTGEPVEFEGEVFSPTWRWQWIEVGATLPDGTIMVPIQITSSAETTEYAALYLADDDLALAQASFDEAAKFGTPDDKNLIARALIHAGVTSYARPFAGGVRGFKLTPEFFDAIWRSESLELHNYLYALRDKHVAHSVNSMERSETVGHVTTDNSFKFLATNPSGVGVIRQSMIGLPMAKLRQCPIHIAEMRARIEARTKELEPVIHAQMLSQLTVGKRVALVPLVEFPDRGKVGKRRG